MKDFDCVASKSDPRNRMAPRAQKRENVVNSSVENLHSSDVCTTIDSQSINESSNGKLTKSDESNGLSQRTENDCASAAVDTESGQRDATTDPKFGSSDIAILNVPKIPISLQVRNFSESTTEDEIRGLFAAFGPVTSVRLVRDQDEALEHAYFEVSMESLTDADYSIAALSEIKTLYGAQQPLLITYAPGELEKLSIPPENAVPGINQTRLFIGSLSRQATEDDVRTLFQTVCAIEEVYVIREMGTGLSRGCAFAVLATKEAAIYVIRKLNHTTQLAASRPLEIRFADIKTKSASNQGDSHAREDGGYHAHTDGNQSRTLVSSQTVNASPRERNGWVEFFTEQGCPYYYSVAEDSSQWEKPTDFDIAGPPGANLFIFHVPSEWTLRELIYYFRDYGSIISATIATDKSSGRNRGYAFVSYTNIQSAVAAVKAMNGYAMGAKRLKVTIKQNEESYVAHLLNTNKGGEASKSAQARKQFASPY